MEPFFVQIVEVSDEIFKKRRPIYFLRRAPDRLIGLLKKNQFGS